MPRIQQLSPLVVSKIAAGEVIERPASVLKELLENAVDAGARHVNVEVERGGVELLRVVDDGGGIHPDDLPLAFANHATSKLTKPEDLGHIQTLGFRGEALASIGSVAQVTLQSRPADLPWGAEVQCAAGQVSPVRAWNGSPGTRIEVRHLFYNTPVRRKFLRSGATELGHVYEAFTRLALAQPHLHLTLRNHGKVTYDLPASAGLRQRLHTFFGAEVADRLYFIEASQGPIRLHGFIADPACERGSAKLQYLFVNGRWVRDRSLGHALQEGYRGLLMSGRYAVAFLFFDLPADCVDVNVHPTKAEVRFREPQVLYHLVLSAVRQRLRAESLVPRLQIPTVAAPPPSNPPGPELWTAVRQQDPQPAPVLPPLPVSGSNGPAVAVAKHPDAPASPAWSPSGGKAIQLHNAYLVVETAEGMLVIDQHALHERILFEQFRRRLQEGPLETQRLLIPEPVDLTAEQAARALDHREDLKHLGLGIEDFGGGTVLLTSYPAILSSRSPELVLQAVVDYLASRERVPDREQLLHDLLSLMACHAAVKAGEPLSPEEIASLLEQRQLADDSHHCPHGRPTSLLFSRQELDRQFRRT